MSRSVHGQGQEIRFCRAEDGVMLAYARVGSGPPLIKAANWLSHLEHDWNSPIWRPLLERLAEHNTLIRYDERGCGLSDWEVDDLSFDSWVRDLEAVADATGLERFPLLGISQGGPVAIAYAARHPERVSRLILYGTYLRGRLRRDAGPREQEEAAALLQLVRIGWGRENPAYRQIFASIFLPDADQEQARAFTELQRLSTSPANAARMVAGFDDVDVSDLAPTLDVPTLVLHVRGDARIPFEEGRRVAALVPGARFVPLEGRNHGLLPGDPAFEPFLNEVRRFLAEGEPPARPSGGGSSESVVRAIATLTPREREVLELLARGLDNPAIADALFISPKTVRNHTSAIFAKLGAGHRAAAVVLAREAGFGRGD